MYKIFVLFMALLFSACSSDPPSKSGLNNFQPTAVDDPFKITWQTLKDGIHAVIIADKELNLVNNNGTNQALAVSICIMQMNDPTIFKTNVAIEGGIDKALNCTIDKDEKTGFGALATKSFYIQPNTLTDVTMDRVQNARYLAVVAGYNHLNAEKSTAIFEYPIKTTSEGIIFRDTLYSATPMDLQILLSADSVSLDGVERIMPKE